jgi:hypothetical protein
VNLELELCDTSVEVPELSLLSDVNMAAHPNKVIVRAEAIKTLNEILTLIICTLVRDGRDSIQRTALI